MSNLRRPAPYAEAELFSVESNEHQHPSGQEPHKTQQNDHFPEIATFEPSQSVQMTEVPSISISSVQDKNSSGIPRSEFTSAQLETSPQTVNHILTDMPAIIIHSAISTPGDDDMYLVDRLYCSATRDQIHNDQSYENSGPILLSQTDRTREVGNLPAADIESAFLETLQNGNNKTGLTYQRIASTDSSILHEADENNFQFLLKNEYSVYRNTPSTKNTSETGKKLSMDLVYKEPSGARSVSNVCAPNRERIQPRFRSHDSLVKRSHNQSVSKRSCKSNSMEEGWTVSAITDRLRTDNLSSSGSIIRQRSGTLDESTLSSNQKFRQKCRKSCNPDVLTTTSVISKSYNDLSGQHRYGSKQDSYYAHGVCKCPQCSSSPQRNQSLLGTPNKRAGYNLSSSHVHRSGEDNHNSRHYLLPETRSLHGARGMRSVSVDDMRMRNGRDDYVWKDGKVQLKNGGISHGESVRYVWKDGHVEKITSDANNEDTQVEILETTDSKACSKINPVFVCVFLIAVITIVVILPIYFSS